MDKTVAIYTLGCKVNQCESQEILDALRRRGWRTAGFGGPASLYIVNTCTVTQAADRKSRGIIRGAKKHKPDAMLVVTGCYTENGRAMLDGIRDIDLILTNRQKEELPELIENAWIERNAPDISCFSDLPEEGAPRESINRLDRTRAKLKLQDGCHQFCSYCVIPLVRRERYSMPEEEALARVARMAEAGYREVVLLGIHLGAYGWETGEQDRLAGLYRRLLEAFPAIRFRLGSVEPMEITERLLLLIRDYPNACKHLHLPLQSGCDKILQAMNRPYSAAAYRDKLCHIRQHIPDIALTTDIMTGFPGEGEEEHRQSLAFAGEMAFSLTHVFVYSGRPGTAAAEMPDKVANKVKERRSKEFILLGKTMAERYGSTWVGRVQQVLMEEEISAGNWLGRSDNYLEVTFTVPAKSAAEPRWANLRGELLPLKITGKSLTKAGAWQAVADGYSS